MSKQIREVLEKNIEQYSKFTKIKDAYDYFIAHNKLGLTAEILSYDNFWGSYKKIVGKPAEAPKTAKKATSVQAVIEASAAQEVVIKAYDPTKEKVDEEIFVPIPLGKGIDTLLSTEGGAMPGTTVVVTGGPGTGKSTLCFDAYYSIQQVNKTRDCMCLSSEMKRIDIQSEFKDKPWMKKVKHIILSEYKKEEYIQVVTQTILKGHEFLVIDSFQSIVERLKNFCGFSTNEASNFLLELIERANNGDTVTGHHTCVFLIQQVTKGGVFVGANNLKHDTTAMLELRVDENDERYCFFSKNRRNGKMQFKKMYYSLSENGNEVEYDLERFNDDLERDILLRKEKKSMSDSKSTFEEMILNAQHSTLESLMEE